MSTQVITLGLGFVRP